MKSEDIIEAALAVRTVEQACALEEAMADAIGGRYQRPLGDRWNNFGLITAGGSYDHKLIENVTNMQDAVVERAALERFGRLDAVPYATPREAADGLFVGIDSKTLGDKVTVEFHESDPPTSVSRRLTAIFRDHGCGMTATEVPETIFHLGSAHKDAIPWLQGAFGLGGLTGFRNAAAVVLVTRKAPALLPAGERDHITLAVLLWEEHDKGKGAYYLVHEPWEGPGGVAKPLSVPAAECPDFDPGTHIALVSYGVEGFHRSRLGDERTFDTVTNTRLFNPMTPVRFRNETIRSRSDYLRGLRKRLEDNPRDDRQEGSQDLPYHINGTTYHLPVSYFVFSRPKDEGARRKYVAYEHAVMFTSNGQVHSHWTPQDFRARTKLSKLADRILVVVETDQLPIRLRTSFFTADRSQLVRNDPAIRLEEEVAGFLNDWDDLWQINGEIIREMLGATSDSRSTLAVAKKIARAMSVKGFSSSGSGKSGGGAASRKGTKRTPIQVYDDPTTLEGPEHAVALTGRSTGITYTINAVDGFIPRRAELAVKCDHPLVNDREITVGDLRRGHVRVSVAVPDGADNGDFGLHVVLDDWVKTSGGAGARMAWETTLVVRDELEPRAGNGAGKRSGTSGPGEGNLVALVWSDPSKQEQEWSRATVGEVLPVPAKELAAEREDYAGLAELGDVEIPTVFLNEEYAELRSYLDSRVRDVETSTIEQTKDRYAVGIGVGLLLLEDEIAKRKKRSESIDQDWVDKSRRAAARSVLSVLPDFDRLAQEAGIEV